MADLERTLPYSISYIEVAAWDWDAETWGSPQSFSYAQGIELDPQIDTDELKSRGAVERGISVLTFYENTIMGAGIDTPVMTILDGTSSSLSGTGTSAMRRVGVAGGTNAPYFGLIAHLPIDGGQVALVGFPLCQISTRLNFSVEQNKFVLPEFSFRAMRLRKANDSTLDIVRKQIYGSAIVPTPPTNFNTFFA